MEWKEIAGLGVNLGTMFAVLAVFFSFQGFLLHLKQGRICMHGSVESISFLTMSYFCAMNAAFVLHGVREHLLADVLSGSLAVIMYVPILLALYEYKPPNRWTHYFFLFLIMVVVTGMILPLQGWIFLVLSLGGLYSQLHQTLVILRNKTCGDLRVQIFYPYVGKTGAWVIYAYTQDDWVQKITSPLYLMVLGSTILACWVFPKGGGLASRRSEV